MRTTLLDRSSAFATAILLGGLGIAASSDAQEFSYNGDTGPGYWAELSDAWEACAGTGTDARQSPINIRSARFDRKLGRLGLETSATTIDLINNGHTIEQHYEDTGSSIVFEGREYELSQFHFHTASYYTYEGSLTTPPCTENVTWVLLKTPAAMSAAQFGAFRSILGNDFRPIQDLNGRIVRVTLPKFGPPK